MFCKYCGKEIDNDALFCNHCGKEQENRDTKDAKSSSQNPLFSIPFALYVMWFFVNYYLLHGDKYYYSGKYFFPFFHRSIERSYNDNFLFIPLNYDKKCYDFSEFFVYVVLLPGLIYVAYKMYAKYKDKINIKWLTKSKAK